jgi:hypothetical protein
MSPVRRDDTRSLIIGVLSGLISTAILGACGIIWHWFKSQSTAHALIYFSVIAFTLGIIGEAILILIRFRVPGFSYHGKWSRVHSKVTFSAAFLFACGFVLFDVFLYLWSNGAWLRSLV